MASVVVVGPGALGTLFAVRLHAAGHDVTMATRTAKQAKELAKKGLLLLDDRGRHVVHVPTTHKAGQEADAVVIATKCAAAPDVAAAWRQAPHVPIIGLQNGLLGDAMAQAAGPGYVPCTVGFPATYEDVGVSRETGTGALHVGPWPDGAAQAAHEGAARLLKDVAPTFVSSNMRGVAWTKLLINSVGMVGTLAGVGLGDLLKERAARDAFVHIIREGHEAGLADGVDFEKVAGFHPKLLSGLGRIGGRPAQHAVIGLIGRKYRRMRSSSLQSLGRGQRTEALYLNGHIQATAQRHGIHTPVNDAILAGIHDIERGARPGMERLADLPL